MASTLIKTKEDVKLCETAMMAFAMKEASYAQNGSYALSLDACFDSLVTDAKLKNRIAYRYIKILFGWQNDLLDFCIEAISGAVYPTADTVITRYLNGISDEARKKANALMH